MPSRDTIFGLRDGNSKKLGDLVVCFLQQNKENKQLCNSVDYVCGAHKNLPFKCIPHLHIFTQISLVRKMLPPSCKLSL